jgi:4'-phosphopantetheinyl transferase
MKLPLEESEAHVWLIRILEIRGIRYEVLSSEEVARAGQFAKTEDGLRYSASRACLRLLLSRYTGIPAGSIVFRYNRFGKPGLKEEHDAAWIEFNVSHSGEYAMFGFSRCRPIGVDVEMMRNDSGFTDLAPEICSDEELRSLGSVAEEHRAAELYRYWTLKEAYVKAIGLGLSFPHRRVGISVTPDGYSILAGGTWTTFLIDGIPGYAASSVAAGSPVFRLHRGIDV